MATVKYYKYEGSIPTTNYKIELYYDNFITSNVIVQGCEFKEGERQIDHQSSLSTSSILKGPWMRSKDRMVVANHNVWLVDRPRVAGLPALTRSWPRMTLTKVPMSGNDNLKLLDFRIGIERLGILCGLSQQCLKIIQ